MERAPILPRLLVSALLGATALSFAAGQPAPKAGSAGAAARAPARASAPGTAAAKSRASGVRAKTPARPRQKPGEVLDLDWRELLPANERAHYSAAAPPPEHGPLGEGGPPALQKQTTTVNADLANLTVRMPGFVVPLSPPRDGMVKEFFLVPYIGECIHVPPPPPNQMVYVTSTSGIPANAIHEAYWVTGKMRIETRKTKLGTAAYVLSAGKVELYQY
ncbi:MAG: DUF3299 domain-containing protein [Steroidobacteraceae bacterium]|nr:DUF3299 domain-containing protein [Steroidobacteraceae bacterium]